MKPKIKLETVAAMCHAANREFCLAHGENIHLPWDEETQENKNVSIQAMKEILATNDLSSPTWLLGELAWINWKKAKAEAGYVYGPVKDREAKTHPCLVDSYSQLSVYEKVKDQIYISLLKMIVNNYEVEV